MDVGTLAIAVLIIVGFIVFILWAKTTAGQKSLKHTFGEPGGMKHRPKATKRRTSTSQKTPKSGKPSTR
jgi:hypothetical protein